MGEETLPTTTSVAIRPISKGAVHKICAGQVILDLSSAVKELVENSLDAGATSVEVSLRDHGLHSFHVVDNGSGISPDNFEVPVFSFLSFTFPARIGLIRSKTERLRLFDCSVAVACTGSLPEAPHVEADGLPRPPVADDVRFQRRGAELPLCVGGTVCRDQDEERGGRLALDF